MVRIPLALALFLAAATAVAQETAAPEQPPAPDYSRDKLMKVLVVDQARPKRPSRVKFEPGAVTFLALGQRWRFPFLPLMPLSGSRLTTSIGMPNPFELTGTEIARPPRTWRDQRAMSAEMRRIERTEREKRKRARVRVTATASE